MEGENHNPDNAPGKSILLVDDHPVVLEGLSSLILSRTSYCIAGMARSGREAVELAARLKPDIVLLDYFLGDGMEGTDLVRAVRPVVSSSARLIVLSGRAGGLLTREAIECGAYAVLPKNCQPETLVEALNGTDGTNGPTTESLLHPIETLSPRERSILRLLAAGMPVREIAQSLMISRKTVETHRSNIRVKLGIETCDALRRYARDFFTGLRDGEGI